MGCGSSCAGLLPARPGSRAPGCCRRSCAPGTGCGNSGKAVRAGGRGPVAGSHAGQPDVTQVGRRHGEIATTGTTTSRAASTSRPSHEAAPARIPRAPASTTARTRPRSFGRQQPGARGAGAPAQRRRMTQRAPAGSAHAAASSRAKGRHDPPRTGHRPEGTRRKSSSVGGRNRLRPAARPAPPTSAILRRKRPLIVSGSVAAEARSRRRARPRRGSACTQAISPGSSRRYGVPARERPGAARRSLPADRDGPGGPRRRPVRFRRGSP